MQAPCASWFAHFFERLSHPRNPEADVVLGRKGDGVVLAYLGQPKFSGTFTVQPEKVALVKSEDYWAAKDSHMPIRGIFAKSRKEVEIPADTYMIFSSQLKAWSLETGAQSYPTWDYTRRTFFRSNLAKLREWKNIDPEARNPNIVPEVFRRVFAPYLRKTVRRGGKIHINLHPEDEAFLKEINSLPKRERASRVRALINEYFSGKHSETGSLTRLELLKVASDPELYSASIFYRDYSDSISAAKASDLWIGPGKAPAFNK